MRKGRTATLRYRVNDALSPKAKVTIRIRKLSGRLVKSLPVVTRTTNAATSSRFTCGLAKGRYRFYIEAKDLAGNKQSSEGLRDAHREVSLSSAPLLRRRDGRLPACSGTVLSIVPALEDCGSEARGLAGAPCSRVPSPSVVSPRFFGGENEAWFCSRTSTTMSNSF